MRVFIIPGVVYGFVLPLGLELAKYLSIHGRELLYQYS
jgi:hypothetical protein